MGRKQLVCINSQSFEELAITSKVPQGSILGLPFFIIVNSFDQCTEQFREHNVLFAYAVNISFLYFLSVQWRKLNSSPVCFWARYVSCDTRHTSDWSYWGCGDKMQAQVRVTITTTANRILLPPKQFLTIPSLEWYKIPGYNSVSPELILSVLSTPNWISSDQELLLWHGEDLVNFSEEDNGGTVCVNLYALFV